MRALFMIMPLVVIVPIGIVMYFYFLRMAGFFKLNIRSMPLRIISALLSAALAVPVINIWGVWTVVMLHLVVFILLMLLINFIVVKTSKTKGEGRWKNIYRCGIIPVLATVFVLLFAHWQMLHVVETDYTIYTEKNIDVQGYRVVFLSDLHMGTSLSMEQLQGYGDEITALAPDLVVLGGDIVDERSTLEEVTQGLGILGDIKSTYGVVYVYGNHDRATYSNTADFTRDQLDAALDSAGIVTLADDVYELNDQFAVIGREDRSFYGTSGRESSEALTEGLNPEAFWLLVDHQPVELETNAASGYDLQLSGHTHGGQIFPVGLISDMLGFGEMNYGYGQIGDYQVIVSSGIAGWGYALRTGHPSEYVVVDIQPAQS